MSLDFTSPRQPQVNEGDRGDAGLISDGSRDIVRRVWLVGSILAEPDGQPRTAPCG